MWQSKEWNGQEAAFRITTVILAVLIFVSLPDGDVPDGFVLPPRGR
jgi:predicted small integral membrane protein